MSSVESVFVEVQLDRLLEQRRYAQAREVLQELFAQDPRDPVAHRWAARLALAEGSSSKARHHLRQVLSQDPADFDGRHLLFQVELQERRWAEAEEVLLGLLREEPADPDLLTNYSWLMLCTVHTQKARELQREAIRRQPDHQGARIVGALLSLVEGAGGQARREAAQLLREDPQGADRLATLFAVLINERCHREALEIGRELLRLDPGDEELVEALVELRALTHWVAWPAYPFVRWGWAASAVIWVAAMVSVRLLATVDTRAAAILAFAFIAYVIYSWTFMPILRRWLRWRGL
ncbi:MAG: tetratricopeptide repeat protein [Acidobacteriota bacterium]|nr:tetratricopeptide repeat protein [Acidobacteriota bacterium]